MENGDNVILTAHWWAVHDDGARRAEQVRAAASKAFFDLDSDESARRDLAARSRPFKGPFVPGQVVYWWRTQGTKVMSKRLQQSVGWRGPAVVLATEGLNKLITFNLAMLILCFCYKVLTF